MAGTSCLKPASIKITCHGLAEQGQQHQDLTWEFSSPNCTICSSVMDRFMGDGTRIPKLLTR